MPIVKVTPQRRIHLDLNLSFEEAEMLMGMLQNPLSGRHPEEEDPLEASVRCEIFTALFNELQEKNPLADLLEAEKTRRSPYARDLS